MLRESDEFTAGTSAMPRSNDVVCPTCSSNAAMRVSRNGFLQQNVLSLFGFYPWKCGACGALFLSRHRGHRTHASGREGEPGAGPTRRQA